MWPSFIKIFAEDATTKTFGTFKLFFYCKFLLHKYTRL